MPSFYIYTSVNDATGQPLALIVCNKGMPHYRVPNSKKILYKFDEIDEWLASGKVTGESND